MLIWEMIAHQRRQLAHLLDDFDEAQWRTPSLCADWTVREVVGHLITPFAWGTAKFLRRFVVGGCNVHKTMSQAAKQLASARRVPWWVRYGRTPRPGLPRLAWPRSLVD